MCGRQSNFYRFSPNSVIRYDPAAAVSDPNFYVDCATASLISLHNSLEKKGVIRESGAMTGDGQPLGRLDTKKFMDICDHAVIFVDQRGPEADKKSFTGKHYAKWNVGSAGNDPLQNNERVVCANCPEFALYSECPHAYAIYKLRHGTVERESRPGPGRPKIPATQKRTRENCQKAAAKRRKTATLQIPPRSGITNVANNCYINAALQILKSDAHFEKRCEESAHPANCNQEGFCPACTLCQFLARLKLWQGPELAAPSDVWTDNLALINPELRKDQQGDPHEFLLPLLEKASDAFETTGGGNPVDTEIRFQMSAQVHSLRLIKKLAPRHSSRAPEILNDFLDRCACRPH